MALKNPWLLEEDISIVNFIDAYRESEHRHSIPHSVWEDLAVHLGGTHTPQACRARHCKLAKSATKPVAKKRRIRVKFMADTDLSLTKKKKKKKLEVEGEGEGEEEVMWIRTRQQDENDIQISDPYANRPWTSREIRCVHATVSEYCKRVAKPGVETQLPEMLWDEVASNLCFLHSPMECKIVYYGEEMPIPAPPLPPSSSSSASQPLPQTLPPPPPQPPAAPASMPKEWIDNERLRIMKTILDLQTIFSGRGTVCVESVVAQAVEDLQKTYVRSLPLETPSMPWTNTERTLLIEAIREASDLSLARSWCDIADKVAPFTPIECFREYMELKAGPRHTELAKFERDAALYVKQLRMQRMMDDIAISEMTKAVCNHKRIPTLKDLDACHRQLQRSVTKELLTFFKKEA